MENTDEKYEIVVSGKLTADQFIRMTRIKNKEKLDTSTFIRLAIISLLNTLDKEEIQPNQIEEAVEEKLNALKLRFVIEATRKYLAANKLPIPTNQELLAVWNEGKYETQPFGRVKTLVEPEALPKWIRSDKDLN